MTRFELRQVGVYDRDNARLVVPQSGTSWDEYQAWLAAGNIADPYVAPPAPAETLIEAKLRRAAAIRAEGLTRIQTRFGALRDFEDLRLIREILLSIAPAALTLTANMAWARDTYQAGAAALAAVAAASTIAAVDAVAPSWPAL